MKILKKIKIGSSIFFDKLEGYKSKDIDWFVLVDNLISEKFMMRCKIGKDDIMIYKHNVTKEELINETINSGISMKLGKFLVPELIEYFNITLEDLKKLLPLSETLDDPHKYEKLILVAYIDNNNFTLTEEQLSSVYNEYKKYRIDTN
jgi:hypothetical protein